jgi:hypothetical protein
MLWKENASREIGCRIRLHFEIYLALERYPTFAAIRGSMKKLSFALVMTIAVSACATKPINTADARSTPPERVYAPELLIPSGDRVELIVARDAGLMGSGCMTAVYFDGRRVSVIDNAEKITLYVLPGRHILGTGPNPDGRALCRLGSERTRRETEVFAELGKQLKYRLAYGANGEISVMPTAF